MIPEYSWWWSWGKSSAILDAGLGPSKAGSGASVNLPNARLLPLSDTSRCMMADNTYTGHSELRCYGGWYEHHDGSSAVGNWRTVEWSLQSNGTGADLVFPQVIGNDASGKALVRMRLSLR